MDPGDPPKHVIWSWGSEFRHEGRAWIDELVVVISQRRRVAGVGEGVGVIDNAYAFVIAADQRIHIIVIITSRSVVIELIHQVE